MEKRLNVLLFLLVIPLFFISCSRQIQSVREGNSLIIYPPPPAKTRIQFLTSISNSLDVTGYRSNFSRFILGDPKPVPIIKPYGIALQKNRIFVCDASVSGIEKLDLENRTFSLFSPKGKGQLKLPVNCCFDAAGFLYVADVGRKQIVVFDQQEQYVDAFGEDGEAKPTDVAVSTDKIWVPDADHNKVNVYQKDTRKFLFSFPDSLDDSEGHLFQPINICVTGDKVYVTDFGDFKIKSYTLEGKFVSAFGSYGNTPGQFVRPKGIAVDREEILYAVDAGFENVQLFNKEGQILMSFGGPYKGPGDMCLPAKVAVDYENLDHFQQYVDKGFKLKYLIFVTNQFGNDKINVYGAVENK